MNFTNLQKHYHELLDYLEKDGYTKTYIQLIRDNILWILKNESQKTWESYIDIYHDRVRKSESKLYQKNNRVAFGIIQRFDLQGKYPNRRNKDSLIKRGAYYQLIPEFKEVIDFYKASPKVSHLKESSIKRNVSGAVSFFCEMQKRGIRHLDCISEKDPLAFFLDDKGNVNNSAHKNHVAAVLKVAADWKESECKLLLAYLPQMRQKRKNIQFLTPAEVESIRSVLENEKSRLSLRERAIGKLLFFTGIRACDIANLKLENINWETDEIYFFQQKTEQPLILPLTATVGNSIYDYLVNERPANDDNHLFLSALYPHYPFEASAVWHQVSKIYKEAGIRQNEGDRRGTHLFRYNVATSFLGNGISRPIISQTLGHASPKSLDSYLHADFVHLKKCALSIEKFPLNEEVFCL